jgi:hypothetical protein
VAHLADGDRVERRLQCPRHLGCDLDAPPCEADDDGVASALARVRAGKPPAGVPPVRKQGLSEDHGSLTT